MAPNEIHVLQGESGSWLVTDGRRRPPIRVFRLKWHAMGFASAIALSRGLEMVVHCPDGSQTRHQRASLTYPIDLD